MGPLAGARLDRFQLRVFTVLCAMIATSTNLILTANEAANCSPLACGEVRGLALRCGGGAMAGQCSRPWAGEDLLIVLSELS